LNTRFSDTAIFIFSRSAKAEAREKRLVSSDTKVNLRMIRLMQEHTRKKAEATGLPVYWVNGDAGRFADFGTLFSASFQKVFQLGYKKVIALGNDCPFLSTSLILEAAEQLQGRSVVLGPATDGGAYLVGVSRSCFDEVTFSALPWQKTNLLDAFQSFLDRNGLTFSLLTEYADLDKEPDLLRLLSLPLGKWAQLEVYRQLLYTVPLRRFSYLSKPFLSPVSTPSPSRAPPVPG
jgi:glycosyltransferase A (GT-A) superfamily protein (DUF2064 family)